MTQRAIATAALFVAVLLSPGAPVGAQDSKTSVQPATGISWKGAGVPSVSTAVVNGDMSKGASHFYLKYNKGLVTPVHYHSADHFVTTISGTLVLVVDGKEQRLGPGSFFALVNKAKHAARCEGAEDCVMFVDARSAWDVVADK